MHKRKELTLLLALFLLAVVLTAQVKCSYHGLKDTLTKNMLTNLDINNFTSVEIHNALDARAYNTDGKLVYRYYVPKMINARWNGKWSLTPGEGRMGRPEHAFTDGRLLLDELDFPTYTGDLRMLLTLRHPLDTQSIVCQTEMTLPLAKGIIDFDRMTDKDARKATGYFEGLEVEFPETTGRFTPANLNDMILVNTSAHTICDDLEIYMGQQGSGRKIYKMKLTGVCIPPGKHSLNPAQIAAAQIEDRFKLRDTLRPIELQYRLMGTGRSGARRIATKLHGAQALPILTYYNPALNIAVDFVAPLDNSSPPLPMRDFTVVEDSAGQVLEIVRPRASRGLDLRPASPFGDFFLSRSLGGLVMYQTMRSDDLTTEQLPGFLAKMTGGSTSVFKTVRQGAYEVVFPVASPTLPGRGQPRSSTMLFAVRYHKLIYLFGLSAMGGGPGDEPFDVQKFINGIEINGHRLQFSFPVDKGGWPTEVSIVPGTKTVSLTENEYTQRLKTFLVYAEAAGGKGEYEVTLRTGEDRGRLKELLTLPYNTEKLDSVAFPAMKREVLGAKRFTFIAHTEEGFESAWGIPERVSKPGFSLLSHSVTGAEWETTFGIDIDGNLTKWASPGVSRTYGVVDKEISVTGRQVMFYGSTHEGGSIRGFSFSVAEFPAAEVPKEFYRAITLQLNSKEHSIGKTMLHDNEQYDVYRSPLTEGFLFNDRFPGMSLLVTGGKKLYQFTVVGVNEKEILSWLRTVKLEGKYLKIEDNRMGNYKIWLE